MSYCRWSDSDLYVYHSAGSGDWVCMDCPFLNTGTGHPDTFHSFSASTRTEMLRHLTEHAAAGHSSGNAVPRLIDEIAKEKNEP